ncbi:MAG: right-handed parallel beta-helix repeat-containing protein [Fimbriimonadaceae bacterium]|nr:right-handed parallel beta-helix repeat-containing protein [Fimbriimonadaceae bacterium]
MRPTLCGLALLSLGVLAAGPLHAAPAGPVAQYAFDGNLLDGSGLGQDVFRERPQFAEGHRGQGLLVGGEAATVSDRAELRLAPGLRLEGWVRFTGPGTAGQSLVTKEREYMLRTDPAGEGGNFSFFVFLNDWEPRVKSPVVPQIGPWYHYLATWDGAQLTLDINGTVTRLARTGTPQASSAPLELGPCSAVLDDLTIHNPGAAAAGVAHWSFDADLRDDTGHGHDIATAGAQFGAGRVDRAVQFGPQLSLPDHPDFQLAPGLRIDCVVKFSALPPSYGYLAMKDGEYQLRVDSPQEGSRFSFFVNLGGWEPRVQSPVKAQVGVWYRLSAQWDGQQLTLDVNGQRSAVTRSGLAKPGPQPLNLGAVPGLIDDLRIENPRLPVLRLRALQQTESLLRAGRPETLRAVVENLGSPVRDATVSLQLGPGVTCRTPATLPLGELANGAARPVEWTVEAAESLSSWAAVQVSAGTYQPAPYRRVLAFVAPNLQPVLPTLVDPAQPPAGAAPATTWYVDSVAGDNAAAGTSPATAWRDFTKVNGKTLGPGERLLLKRGSVFDQELQVTARGTAERWAEIGTYGDGPRPILRRNWNIDERCALVDDPDYLLIRSLVVCYAGKGLVVQYRGGTRRGLVIRDCLAHHIEGLYRVNSHGIPEWRDKIGTPGDGLHSSAGFAVIGNPRDALLQDLEMTQCSWGFFVVGDNVTVDRVYVHDNFVHNSSPHPAMVSTFRSYLTNSLLDAPGWHASAGTMGIMLVNPHGLVIRNCTFRNQPDSGSHDEGGIDFENSGHGTLIDGCTFQNNAGAAIEVLGLQTPQPYNVEIARSRFIKNNVAQKLGPAEVYVWGKSSSADVCCSTGVVQGNGYVTLPGIEWFVNEAPQTTSWTLRDNTAYPDEASLRTAMPLNDPPTALAGADLATDQPTATLAGRVLDSGVAQPAARWEQLSGPAIATLATPREATSAVALPAVGDYEFRLVADDGQLWHSDTVTVHRLPAGQRAITAWEFNTPRDKQGWTNHDAGTKVEDFPHPRWSTRSEPVEYVAGGYYVLAVQTSATAHLLSPDQLNLDPAARTVQLRLMNTTAATRFRLCWTTTTQPTWDDARSVWIDVQPADTAPRVYTATLPALPAARLRQLRLDLGTGTPVTGTVRLDYLLLAAGR